MSPRRSSQLRQGAPRVATRLAPPLPPRPFVGRAEVLAAAQARLNERGTVVITGIAGVGKSALGAALVETSPTHWVDGSPLLNGEGAAMLWQIALPLATIDPEAWASLQEMQVAAARSFPLAVQLQVVLTAYAALATPITVVVDHVERLAGCDALALLAVLCEQLARGAAQGLRLVIIGREVPYRLLVAALPPLAPLGAEAIGEWASLQGLPLDAAGAEQLHLETDGLPGAVSAALIWRSGAEPAYGPERPLWDQLQTMSADERRLLLALARGELSEPLGFEQRALLVRLEDMHLASRPQGRGVVLNPLIRRFVLRMAALL